MNSSVILLAATFVSLLSGCSLIGAELGEEVDESSLGDASRPQKYQAQYFEEGLEIDAEIIKALLHEPEVESPYVVDYPCKGGGRIQVCSVKKGCWCETALR
jgi:hypothetical protein